MNPFTSTTTVTCMYARGNPLKYTDPSGHCASNEDGSRAESDAACWEIVDTIHAFYDNDPWWQERWKVSGAQWMENIAPAPFATESYLQEQLDTYLHDLYHRIGIYHERYNPAPVMNPVPPEPMIRLPGSGTVIYLAVSACNTWDCMALASDVAGLGLSLYRDSAILSIPVTGPLGVAGATTGEIASRANSTISYGRTWYLRTQGQASNADLVVGTITYGASFYPGVAEVGGVVQLVWDLFDPIIPDD